MATHSLNFVAAGGNRHPAAADWTNVGLIYGAGKNVAICSFGEDYANGLADRITHLLPGHTDDVNAVRIIRSKGRQCFITGSADKSLRMWSWSVEVESFTTIQTLAEHAGSINAVAILEEKDLFVSGSADGTLKVWSFTDDTASLVQTVVLKPRYIPLTCTLAALQDGSIVLAVAGTSNSVQLYVRPAASAEFVLQATLTGHEGWIRSLDFASIGSTGDLLLASASQDKYIRLWRFSRAQEIAVNGETGLGLPSAKDRKSLSNKAHQVGSEAYKYGVTFEALLIGHEDWIYTVRWDLSSAQSGLRLLSSSADNSLAVWQADESSGVWICQTRLGEISSQKGSTSATGSTGGFWIGLWQPDGRGVASLGRTGSWRRWRYEEQSDTWLQQVSLSGHVKEVQGLAWAPDGSCLLSTSSDRTTRLWAPWQKDISHSWHEVSRPQIHGYDLNCIASHTSNQFISGADEKLLRVFNKPKAIDNLMAKLCGIQSTVNGELPDVANIPVLGLSNKAVAAAPDEDEIANGIAENGDDREAVDPSAVLHKSTLDLDQPPLEDHLARHTLWPEHEKLYGHGYEISAVAASPDGSVVATACKASSIDHAVIRIYECRGWREVKPPLRAHSLTVTALAFSPDSQWLLSVGRDRQWALFERKADGEKHTYELFRANPKGHSRMILDCCWAPLDVGAIFATAGRDKAVKLWKIEGDGEDAIKHITTISTSSAVTAVNISPMLSGSETLFAHGTEDGSISIVLLAPSTLELVAEAVLPATLSPSAAVNALRWRPGFDESKQQLAVASDDSSVRIIGVVAPPHA